MAQSKKPQSNRILPKKISLALQGGGVHGAFAWGGVHQLLEDGRVDIEAISASGGGAIQAVVLAEGFRLNGTGGAIAHLEHLWRSISLSASLMPLKTNPFIKFLGDVKVDFAPTTMAMDVITRMFSPYQFNMLDVNPLRGILTDLVDFEALKKDAPCPIYLSATHAKTGEGHIFTNKDLSLETVMASSCLPFLFKTVMVDGEPYWDGAYSANPSLRSLISDTEHKHILLLQTITSISEDVPTQASDILDHATDISFQQALKSEMEALKIHAMQHPAGAPTLHIVESNDMLSSLGRATKLNVDADFVNYLHDLGAQAVSDWLDV